MDESSNPAVAAHAQAAASLEGAALALSAALVHVSQTNAAGIATNLRDLQAELSVLRIRLALAGVQS